MRNKLSKTKNAKYLRNWRKNIRQNNQLDQEYRVYSSMRHNNYVTRRLTYDPVFKLKMRYSNLVGCLIRLAKSRGPNRIKNLKQPTGVESLLGCTVDEFYKHIAKTFKPGMDWSNYGKQCWRIERIKPLSKFNLKDPKERKLAFSYLNCKACWVKPPNG